jgi:hypothetical protein
MAWLFGMFARSQLAMDSFSDSIDSSEDSSSEESVAAATPLFPKARVAPVKQRSRAKDPVRGNSKSLSLAIQLALLQAFEAGGGREVFFQSPCALPQLLDSDKAKFGRGLKQRTKIRQKVRYWRDLPDSEYQELLESFSIVPFFERQRQSANRKRPSTEPTAEESPTKKSSPYSSGTSTPTMASAKVPVKEMKQNKIMSTGISLPVDPLAFDRNLAGK